MEDPLWKFRLRAAELLAGKSALHLSLSVQLVLPRSGRSHQRHAWRRCAFRKSKSGSLRAFAGRIEAAAGARGYFSDAWVNFAGHGTPFAPNMPT